VLIGELVVVKAQGVERVAAAQKRAAQESYA
jgi:hypothetical protein